ncbi:type IV toxin-antitoxin system AbiEi family antitoxin domain-containing protein [Treponema pedis]|uniref:Transcriptional regulator n=1 Tax=Treponema pedis TaxID=409322 RepID=A0A7S7AWV1_9SPIR|nr:transcriptional regulator [Treponema pedis]QOW61327.1 transcriptional regulator [Treponema pedis]
MNTVLEKHLLENGIITNKIAEKIGIKRHTLANLVKTNKLDRIKSGVYKLKNDIQDEFIEISANSTKIIFSYQTALYLHGLTDRTPNKFHISVPQGYNAGHIKKRFIAIVIHYIKKELFEHGIQEIKTPLGNTVKVYDKERCICELIAGREKIDKQTYTLAITNYFSSQDKNLRKLIEYSKRFRIEEEVRKYNEVLA